MTLNPPNVSKIEPLPLLFALQIPSGLALRAGEVHAMAPGSMRPSFETGQLLVTSWNASAEGFGVRLRGGGLTLRHLKELGPADSVPVPSWPCFKSIALLARGSIRGLLCRPTSAGAE